MTWQEHFPNLVSTTILLRTATLDDLDSFFRQCEGASGGAGWWIVNVNGAGKIDVVGVDGAETTAVSSRYGSWVPTDWEPTTALDAYAKCGPHNDEAMRRLLTALLERYEGIVIWPDDSERPLPQDLWTLEEIRAGSNRSRAAFLSQ